MVDHSDMRLGKHDAVVDPTVPDVGRYLAMEGLPLPPASSDWTAEIEASDLGWPMMLNDSLGDCTAAGVGHAIQQRTAYATGGKPLVMADEDLVGLYTATGGYDPTQTLPDGTNPTDHGARCTDVLAYWLKTGVRVAGQLDQLSGYASVAPINTNHVRSAIDLFGGLYCGLQLPISAQTQDVWDVPPEGISGDTGQPGSWGGHCVYVVAFSMYGLTCVTWGSLKRMTWNFWRTYADEAYALLDKDFMDARGISPAAIPWQQLAADMALVRA